MTDFEAFDTRGYRTVDVRSGYGEWVTTYEQTVEDAMDIHLLEVLREVPWGDVQRAADLGCGTGRTGAWLRERGIASIDGVDLTPEMLDVARAREVYAQPRRGRRVGHGPGAGRLRPRGRPAWSTSTSPTCARSTSRPGASLAPTASTCSSAFTRTSSWPRACRRTTTARPARPVAIETYVHLLSDHVSAGLAAGWTLVEMRERVIDDAWLELKPKWASLRDQPIAFAVAWRGARRLTAATQPFGR